MVDTVEPTLSDLRLDKDYDRELKKLIRFDSKAAMAKSRELLDQLSELYKGEQKDVLTVQKILEDSITFKWAVKGIMIDHCNPYIVEELPDHVENILDFISQRLKAAEDAGDKTKLVTAKAILLYAKSNIIMTYAGYELKTILSQLE